jgi:hypothetical protein
MGWRRKKFTLPQWHAAGGARTGKFDLKQLSESEFYEDANSNRNQMSSLWRHGVCEGPATSPARSQNLSATLQGMFGQGTNWIDAPLKALAWKVTGRRQYRRQCQS